MLVGSRRTRKYIKSFLLYLLLAIVLVWVLFPIYLLALNSIRLPKEIFQNPPTFIPREVSPKGYLYLLGLGGIAQVKARPGGSNLGPLLNSLIIASSATLLAMIIGSLAAYSFARFKTGGYNLSFWILSCRMLPPIATAIPVFLLFRTLHLLDTHLGLVIVYMAFNIPFVAWLMRGFFLEIPIEIEECGMIDGCSRFSAFLKLILPLAAPGLAAVAILTFIFSWNEFMFALILTRDIAKTAPVLIAEFYEADGINWPEMSATIIFASAPILLLAIVMQKFIVKGLTFGALK